MDQALNWSDPIRVGESEFAPDFIIEKLSAHLTDERKLRLREVVGARSRHLVPILENIYDRGNVSAVMRSSEAFGFLRLDLVDRPGARFKAANRVTRGAEKWLDVRAHASAASAVENLRAGGYQIWATDLNTDVSIDQLDWQKPHAIVLGNEKDGVSQEMLDLVDGRFRIPMAGFSQSFNISVAAALIFYRAHLEFRALGAAAQLSEREQKQVLANYYLRCFDHPEAILKKSV